MNQITHYSLSDYRDILFRVQELAITARSDYQATHEKPNSSSVPSVEDLSFIDPEEYAEERRNNPLFIFLNRLDDEQIKVVQTVMYIGRDHEVPAPSDEEWDEYYERKTEDPEYDMPKPSLCVSNPDDYLSETIELLGRGKGWQDKFIEIDVIIKKMMKLPDYLSRGFQVLGIK